MLNNYKEILDFLEQTIVSACEIYLTEKVKTFKHKTTNDILTDTDIKMQKFLLDGIIEKYPELHIISEEKENTELPDGMAICVDPLDGTCNFSVGLPMFGVQMALFEHKDVVASIIVLPLSKDVYKAIKGDGVYLNGNKLVLNNAIKQTESVLLLSDFYPKIAIDINKQYELVKKLQSHFLKTRLFGAACFDFTSLITSRAQAYVCYYHEIWDIAPGLLMAKEMGMAVSGLNGNYELRGSSLVVALNEGILNDILGVYKSL